ncbi:hypothetical protein Hypma_015884 [Hypsizygus marmoreus]|uniref:Uncharacterized protein n=1 Tax=Hypsizygus marmoreus TaxID=39966 RepID=A0A369K6Q1_HYPMA|nr:hypothetical protein Hypma_015884 [Hypsizygus marmoreus]
MDATIKRHIPSFETYPKYYQGFFVPDESSTGCIVDVPAEPDVRDATNVDELALDRWVPIHSKFAVGVFDPSQFSVKLESETGTRYSLCYTSQTVIEGIQRKPNLFLHHHLEKVTWYGNLLVIKHDPSGYIGDVEVEEVVAIEKMVLRYFRDHRNGGSVV